jgi:hypothetical protein
VVKKKTFINVLLLVVGMSEKDTFSNPFQGADQGELTEEIDFLCDAIDRRLHVDRAYDPLSHHIDSSTETELRAGFLELVGLSIVGMDGHTSSRGETWGTDNLLSPDEKSVREYARAQIFGDRSPFTTNFLEAMTGHESEVTSSGAILEFRERHPNLGHIADTSLERRTRFADLLRSISRPEDDVTYHEVIEMLRDFGQFHYVLPPSTVNRLITSDFGKEKPQSSDSSPGRLSLTEPIGEARLWRPIRTGFRTEGVLKPAEVEIIEKVLGKEYSNVQVLGTRTDFLVGHYARALYREAVTSAMDDVFGDLLLNREALDDFLIEITDETSTRERGDSLLKNVERRADLIWRNEYDHDASRRRADQKYPEGTIIPLKDDVEVHIDVAGTGIVRYVADQLAVMTGAVDHAHRLLMHEREILDLPRNAILSSRLAPLMAYRCESRGLPWHALEASFYT